MYRPEGRSGRYSQGGTTREQRCSGLERLRTQSTDGGSVRKDGNLHIPGGENNLALVIGRRRKIHSALGRNIGVADDRPR